MPKKRQSNSVTRERMLLGAIDLIRRRGVNATSVREVVRHTNTPRGSVTHHFPGGKRQLVNEAVTLAARLMSAELQQQLIEHGAVAGLQAFINQWRKLLEENEFRAGCPVLAVTVDEYHGDQPNENAEIHAELLRLAHQTFAGWQVSLTQALVKEGVTNARAESLATLIVTSIEGSVALCRAEGNARALNVIAEELLRSVGAAVESANS